MWTRSDNYTPKDWFNNMEPSLSSPLIMKSLAVQHINEHSTLPAALSECTTLHAQFDVKVFFTAGCCVQVMVRVVGMSRYWWCRPPLARCHPAGMIHGPLPPCQQIPLPCKPATYWCPSVYRIWAKTCGLFFNRPSNYIPWKWSF